VPECRWLLVACGGLCDLTEKMNAGQLMEARRSQSMHDLAKALTKVSHLFLLTKVDAKLGTGNVEYRCPTTLPTSHDHATKKYLNASMQTTMCIIHMSYWEAEITPKASFGRIKGPWPYKSRAIIRRVGQSTP
jgi:hypothetical protein